MDVIKEERDVNLCKTEGLHKDIQDVIFDSSLDVNKNKKVTEKPEAVRNENINHSKGSVKDFDCSVGNSEESWNECFDSQSKFPNPDKITSTTSSFHLSMYIFGYPYFLLLSNDIRWFTAKVGRN